MKIKRKEFDQKLFEHGLTVRDLATVTKPKMSESTIYKVRNGKGCSMDTARKICEVLESSISDLFINEE